MNKFRDFVKEELNFKPNIDILPLIHISQGKYLWDILGSKILMANECRIFNEKLLYFFYGRPAYIKRYDNNTRSNSNFHPVAFVINFGKMAHTLKRAFPFDSGAFYNDFDEVASSHFHPSTTLEDLELIPSMMELIPSMKCICNVVEYFFGSNSAYFLGSAKSDIEVDVFYVSTYSYYNLIADRSAKRADSRMYTIEIQFNQDIRLIKEIVEHIIVPSDIFESRHFMRLIAEAGLSQTSIDHYYPPSAIHPESANAQIFEKMHEFLKTRNLF